MKVVNKEQLVVVNTDEPLDVYPLKKLIEIIKRQESNTVYFESTMGLYGILTMGDICQYSPYLDYAKINKSFTKVYKNNYMEAMDILMKRENIQAIPMIDENNHLIGEYSRCDDILLIERYIDVVAGVFNNDYLNGKNIALVLPEKSYENKRQTMKLLYTYLRKNRVNCYIDLIESFAEISDYYFYDYYLFFDDNFFHWYYQEYYFITLLDFPYNRLFSIKEFEKYIKIRDAIKELANKGISVMTTHYDSYNHVRANAMWGGVYKKRTRC